MLDGLARLGSELGIGVTGTPLPDGTEPVAVVVDLDRPGALEEVRSARRLYPDALLAGHLGTPRPDLWTDAQNAGCDLVANRGALAARLRKALESWRGRQRARLALFESSEVAGRLGLVHRAPETPVGPVAVYRIGSTLTAVADTCPHAGAQLSDGELEEGIVTCPRHGSRFDVCTGERVRGPADDPLATYQLVEEGGFVYLILPS